MNRTWLLLLGVLLGLSAHVCAETRPRPWASMLLTGHVDIQPDGSVKGCVMDHPEKIPPVALEVIQQAAKQWRFKVDGADKVIARAKMSVRVVAKPVRKTEFSIAVEGVQFDENDAPSQEDITERSLPPASYPRDALSEHTSATVYVLLRVGRDGHVIDEGVEQVNFTLDCPPSSRIGLQKQFAHASEVAARRWVFNVPTRGPQADQPFWYVRVPIAFQLKGDGVPTISRDYGAWQPYLPGARRSIPWVENKSLLASAPDAVPDGQAVLLGGKLQLAN